MKEQQGVITAPPFLLSKFLPQRWIQQATCLLRAKYTLPRDKLVARKALAAALAFLNDKLHRNNSTATLVAPVENKRTLFSPSSSQPFLVLVSRNTAEGLYNPANLVPSYHRRFHFGTPKYLKDVRWRIVPILDPESGKVPEPLTRDSYQPPAKVYTICVVCPRGLNIRGTSIKISPTAI